MEHKSIASKCTTATCLVTQEQLQSDTRELRPHWRNARQFRIMFHDVKALYDKLEQQRHASSPPASEDDAAASIEQPTLARVCGFADASEDAAWTEEWGIWSSPLPSSSDGASVAGDSKQAIVSWQALGARSEVRRFQSARATATFAKAQIEQRSCGSNLGDFCQDPIDIATGFICHPKFPYLAGILPAVLRIHPAPSDAAAAVLTSKKPKAKESSNEPWKLIDEDAIDDDALLRAFSGPPSSFPTSSSSSSSAPPSVPRQAMLKPEDDKHRAGYFPVIFVYQNVSYSITPQHLTELAQEHGAHAQWLMLLTQTSTCCIILCRNDRIWTYVCIRHSEKQQELLLQVANELACRWLTWLWHKEISAVISSSSGDHKSRDTDKLNQQLKSESHKACAEMLMQQFLATSTDSASLAETIQPGQLLDFAVQENPLLPQSELPQPAVDDMIEQIDADGDSVMQSDEV